MRHVIEEVAEGCSEVDPPQLMAALDDGRARGELMGGASLAASEQVRGSPHVFLPDGTDVHNPGIEMHWQGEHGKGKLVIDLDEPAIYEDLLRRATAPGSDGG
jgi:hypothetical protein